MLLWGRVRRVRRRGVSARQRRYACAILSGCAAAQGRLASLRYAVPSRFLAGLLRRPAAAAPVPPRCRRVRVAPAFRSRRPGSLSRFARAAARRALSCAMVACPVAIARGPLSARRFSTSRSCFARGIASRASAPGLVLCACSVLRIHSGPRRLLFHCIITFSAFFFFAMKVSFLWISQ